MAFCFVEAAEYVEQFLLAGLQDAVVRFFTRSCELNLDDAPVVSIAHALDKALGNKPVDHIGHAGHFYVGYLAQLAHAVLAVFMEGGHGLELRVIDRKAHQPLAAHDHLLEEVGEKVADFDQVHFDLCQISELFFAAHNILLPAGVNGICIVFVNSFFFKISYLKVSLSKYIAVCCTVVKGNITVVQKTVSFRCKPESMGMLRKDILYSGFCRNDTAGQTLSDRMRFSGSTRKERSSFSRHFSV